ncbi:MAG: hypothetical protein GY751_20915, partial [Bacteroidetes bacterium]|nr:hypothetical protein [Bacteroidota bacterium]
TVQMNTVDEEVSGDFDLGGQSAETLTFGAGPYLRVDVEGASLALTGLTSNGVEAELSGDFAFEQSDGVTKIGVNNVTASVDVNGSTGGLREGKGAMIVTGAGIAGSLEGKLAASVPILEAGGTLVLRFNNTGSAIDQEVSVGEESVSVSFSDTEDVFLVSLLGGSLNIGDVVTIEGDVTFYSQNGYKVFAGENMTLFVGEGPLNEDGERNSDARGLMISDATIGLVKEGQGDDAKYALKAEGQVSVVGISALSLSGPISISYNGFTELINETVAVAGKAKQVAVDFVENQVKKAEKAFYEIKGFETPIEIDVSGQRLKANFSVRRFTSDGGEEDDSLMFELKNVDASFGDGTSNFVTLSGGSGTLLSMPDGVALLASGTVEVAAPEVSLSGDMDLKINNVEREITEEGVNGEELDLPEGPYVKFEGNNLSLEVAGQSLSGETFTFEKDSEGNVSGGVTNGALSITSGDDELISLTKINGSFEMSSSGSYGALRVGESTFDVPGTEMSGGVITVQMNTVDEEVSGDFDLDGTSNFETLRFGSGPYLRVDVEGASLALTGLTSNGVEAKLSGNFAFEQSDGVTKIGVNNVTASVDVNGSSGSLQEGKGAMIVTGAGIAGSLEGKLDVEAGGVKADSTLVLHFNNTGSVVDEEVLVGDDRIKLIFENTDNVFSISLLGASLNLGGVLTIEGDLTFTSQGGDKVVGAENMTLCVGEGPLRLDDGAFDGEF